MTPAESQAADAVLMVRPAGFASNPETIGSNRFQQSGPDSGAAIARAAREECERAAAALREAGVRVHLFEGAAEGNRPDEVFPNNWVSFHADGTAVLYPMMAPSRRLERREDVLATLAGATGYELRAVVDLTHHERAGRYLEGTGSLVLDRVHRVAYACLSPRTDADVLADFGRRLGYETFAFEAADRVGHPIYHTNVLMSVGPGFAVVCAAAVRDRSARRALLERLAATDREIIEIDLRQLHELAGNLLALRGSRPLIALSARALASFDDEQRARLGAHGAVVAPDVATLEYYGGGSVRCMLAEIHLPRTSAGSGFSRDSSRGDVERRIRG